MNVIRIVFKKKLWRIAILIIISIIFYLNLPKTDCRNCNVILISVDTLRADHMGVYGYKKNTTPNIDNWAKDAVIFTNAYTVIPSTFHSFFTLFTGKDTVLKNENMANRYANINESADKFSTLPKILKSNDYSTVAFVTNPVIGSANKRFFEEGFSTFSYINTSKITGYHNSKVYSADPENSKKITSTAKIWLKNNQKNKFFLWLHYTTPHFPYNPSIELACKFDKKMCDDANYQKALRERLPICSDNNRNKDTSEVLKNLYDAEIFSTDIQINEIIKTLSDLNLNKNTIVVFYGDHGEGFDHTIFNHGDTVYNSAINIPFIIKLPFVKNTRKISNLIDNSDILPTILDLLKIKHDVKDFSGKSYIANINSPSYIQSENNRKYVYSIATTDKINKISIFDKTYKYIYSMNDYCLFNSQKEELYNLKNDPREQTNLLNSLPEVASKLKTTLLNNFNNVETDNINKPSQELINGLKSLGY